MNQNKAESAVQVIRVPGSVRGELIPLADLAKRLSLHPDTVRGLHRRGKIPGLRIGHRTLRFDYQAVLDALERDQATSKAALA